MSVKFRNPKTGEVFEVTDCCNDMFCKHINCCDCPIYTHKGASQCADYVNEHPYEAAKLMGYEVVEEKEMPKINISKFTDNNKIVVQCKTEEEAKMFCNELHKLGYSWSDGETLKNNSCWNGYDEVCDVYGEEYCYFHVADAFREKTISIGTLEDVEENETLIQFSDLLEEDKPRMCEILGLNVGEEFTVENENSNAIFHIDDSGRVTTGACDIASRVLCDIINHPEKIKNVITFSDEEVAQIKAIKTLYPNVKYIEQINGGTDDSIVILSDYEHFISLQHLEFPSLPVDKEFDITKF